MTIRGHLEAIFKSPDELDLTSGSIARPLIYLSIPLIITNLLQVAYNLADTFWLGQHSTTSLAAISFAFPMVFFLIALALGVSVAGSVLVAQYTGADDPEKAEYAASQTVSYAILTSVVLGAFGYVFAEDVIGLLGAEADIEPLVAGYMEVYSLGLVAVFGFFVFIALMRGYGDTVTPMLVMFGSVVLNIVLDPFLIFGFENNPLFGYLGMGGLEAELYALTGYAGSGIEGAAIATVFSRALAFAVGLAIMFRGSHGVQISLGQMKPELEYGRRLVDIGAPASVEGTARALSINLLLVIIAIFPETVVAAFGIGTRVFSVIFLPAIAFSQGVETMTGQNIGAGKHDRARRTNHFGAKVMLVTLTGLGAVVFLAAEPIVSVFTTDPAVVEEGALFLRYTALTFGFMGVMRSYSGGFRGASRTMIAAVISVLTLGVIRFPLAWLGAELFGSSGVWMAFAASTIIGGCIATVWFTWGDWLDDSFVGEDRPSDQSVATSDGSGTAESPDGAEGVSDRTGSGD
ncbi:MATE family efflux transporter [Natronolimnohabitans innermongolicus]|uniref:MATE efflux family protein n=1 Tax=Natronolimnohabitans innermongolicus JCM 12255 TaxID=1227499 RepID=L9X6F3_9EURY|nr:MATE family efflux transporter [Natronolimnohabitans innermongolicus]ELY57379.1 MATE efflux family protein [Natronolimnohabitans innermongolicus JCM 12255]